MSIGKLLIILIISGCSVFSLHSQVNITATGGNSLGNGGTASYSVGQVFYSIHTDEDGYVVDGRMIQTGMAVGPETIIDMGGLTSTIYFLKILDDVKEIRTFRILKF